MTVYTQGDSIPFSLSNSVYIQKNNHETPMYSLMRNMQFG